MLLPLILTIKQRQDVKSRFRVKQHELPICIDKALARNQVLKVSRKFCFYRQAVFLNSARIKNSCLWNCRSRGLNYKGFSRHAIKFLGTRGRWLGLKKASW
jgi:ribosomal protein S14